MNGRETADGMVTGLLQEPEAASRAELGSETSGLVSADEGSVGESQPSPRGQPGVTEGVLAAGGRPKCPNLLLPHDNTCDTMITTDKLHGRMTYTTSTAKA